MSKMYKSSKTKQLQKIYHDYMEEHGVDMVDLDDVADWAMETGRWQEHQFSPRRRCRRDLANAMREEYITDDDGREVRRMHAVKVMKGEQLIWEWGEIYHMPREKFRASITHRRDKVLGSLKQMKTDQDSWNDHNIYGASLPLFDANFNPDLLEMDQPDDHWPDEDPESSS